MPEIDKELERVALKQIKEAYGDNPFPLTIELECGCTKTYDTLDEVLNDQGNACKHATLFVAIRL